VHQRFIKELKTKKPCLSLCWQSFAWYYKKATRQRYL